MSAEDVFSVLANPVRRRILELLLRQPSTVNGLVDQFDLQRPAVSEHLHVLRKARLVRCQKRGRERYYRIDSSQLVEVHDWLKPFERYGRGRMMALSEVLDEEIND